MKIILTTSLQATHGKVYPSEKAIIRALKRTGVEYLRVSPTWVWYQSTDEGFDIFCDTTRISDADIVIVRTPYGYQKPIYELARLLQMQGAVIVNLMDTIMGESQKLIPHLAIAGKIPMPQSVYFHAFPDIHEALLERLPFSFPFIIKPEDGSLGKGVMLVHTLAELSTYSEKYRRRPMIFQEYIHVKEEYRVLIIGNTSYGACRKISNDLVKNAAQGARFEYVRDPEVETFALNVVASFQPWDFHGVDILRAHDNKLLLLENNRNPIFLEFQKASGIDIGEKIVEYALEKYEKIHQK